MLAYLNDNSMVVVLILGAAILIVMVVVFALNAIHRRERGLNAALEDRMRQESEKQAQTILAFNKLLSESSDRLDEKQDRLRRMLDERLDTLNRTNDRKLEQMRETVTEKLDGRLTESFSLVNKQLTDVHKGLGEMRALAENVTDLKKLFGNVKTRGVWGEVQLKALLDEILSPGQYLENAAVEKNTQMRVEYAIKMPSAENDAEVLLPVDSKFPQEDFLRLTEASASGNAEEVERCSVMLEKALLEQAKTISEKYIRTPATTDYAIMFLPAESLYAEAVRRTGLLEKMQTKYRVLMSGPSTLAALLTSLRMGFRTCTLEKKSMEVMRLLGEVRGEFSKYDESIDKLRQRLSQAESELDNLDTRAKRLSKKLKNVDEYDEQP